MNLLANLCYQIALRCTKSVLEVGLVLEMDIQIQAFALFSCCCLSQCIADRPKKTPGFSLLVVACRSFSKE